MQNSASIIEEVGTPLMGLPLFLTGSLVAEYTYGLENAHSDVDIFCPNPNVMFFGISTLLNQGYTVDDKMYRLWRRWLKSGFNNWHTNSLRLNSPSGLEVNFVYKLIEGKPTTTMSQVLESFDFGLLATGFDLEVPRATNVFDCFRDLRSYLFPSYDVANEPLPLMPLKEEAWSQGFFSTYNGLRMSGRYAKYFKYGHDLSVVKPTLIQGYYAAADYYSNRDEEEKQSLAVLYNRFAEIIEEDGVDELMDAQKLITMKSSYDQLIDSLN